ncbi:hypothetical protein DYB25_002001 [Aphanomyces astaci]|uniref:Ubiquitin-activating enzyme E1 C-terminal domain-containing protein n=2 Tax=Aphanomyces astaci TaxID=112090 RepID=A0A397ASE8_APHAT|nr:hypothetical protein DYB25_002001 [Aphanomyces astaci]
MWGDSKGGGSSGRQGSSMKADPGKKVVVHHVPTSNQTESADAVVESAASTHARRGDDAHIDEKVFLSYHEASVAMALPEPYVTQRNLKLVLVEDYVRLASFVKSDPFSVSPLGYYKSPDGFDIYVFECTLGSVDRPSHLKRFVPVHLSPLHAHRFSCSWKIHRRYRHFDMLLSRLMDPSSSSSSSAAAAARWPSLSGSYLQMFRAKHCKDRLVELHTWLVKAVELLQTFPATSADTTTGDKSHVLFTCFLFAGANTPYVTFPSLPLFAWALEQVHVQLTLSPLYPSRVPNQHAAGGLGLRLAPSTGRADDETGGTIYRGAVVTGFLRDSFDVPNVQYVRLGSHLSHINGVPIENETFDTILLHLRSQSRPMFLTFTLDPRPSSLECQLSEADLRRHDRALSASSMISGSRRTSAASSMDVADVQTPMSVLGSVFHDTLGGSRKRTETMISDNNQDEDDGMLLLCWDDVSGLGMDTVTTGMYLPQTPPAASTPTVQANVRTFLVGCGALGCEYLKNFAMVGVGVGPKGLITVTDNDRIEVSNLNRQFLFREHNVGQPKSVAATAAVRRMNDALNVLTLEHLVAPTTEHVFHDTFWSNDVDFVTNALDNIKARLYVDSKCVFYKKPLLESGTLGTKCNVQVVLPYKTASYADGPKDAPDDNIPMCTLRNFPSLIEHCIEWARAQFEDVFVVPFSDVAKFASDPSTVRALHALVTKPQVEFEDCIALAQMLFTSLFRDRILQLIHNFPEDHQTKTGEKFWSGAKRFPQAATAVDFGNVYHADFIRSVANLYAVNFGLQPPPEDEVVPESSYLRQVDTFAAFGEAHPLAPWVPSSETIAENDEALKKQQEERATNADDVGELERLLNELGALTAGQLAAAGRYVAADFEKDNDLNFHIDFIAAAANLRAWNYRIKQVSRHKCKMIAGKIIPAIATTTASVTGLAMIELLKIVQGKSLDQFKDSSNSLGLNMYLLQEPAEPEKAKDEYDMIEMSEVKCKPAGFTKWDTTLVTPGVTLAAFLDQVQTQVGLNVNLLFHPVAELGGDEYAAVRGLMLYDRTAFSASLKALYKQKLDVPLREWVEERYQRLVDCDRPFVEFQTSCSDDDDVVYKIPTVVCRFV